MAGNTLSHRKPNIRMVAERAQLSPTTVSLALRGDESIPPETRERVLAAARELNYVHAPRPARATEPEIYQLAFVMPDFGDHPVTANPFYGQVLSGAEQECAERGASMTFSIVPQTLAPSAPLPLALHQARPDGLLLVSAYQQAFVERIARELDPPLVLVDNFLPGQPYDTVMADDFGGGYLATRHLLALGHRRIAMLVGTLSIPSFAERYRGYSEACRSAGVEPLSPVPVEYGAPPIAEVFHQLMQAEPRPTAFFCVGDAYAVSIINLARDEGYSVPRDFSVVGFDNLSTLPAIRPALTTVQNHPRALGRIAVQRLMARLSGDVLPPQLITVGVELIVRESTRQL
jgi:LacI family transcriptional regulator